MKRTILISIVIVVVSVTFYLVYVLSESGVAPPARSAPGQTEPIIDITNLTAKAAGGDTAAQAELGKAYAQGLGVKLDYKQAARWYGQAASNGNAEAETMLGELCQAGQGVPRDLAAAQRWFAQAAQNGSVGAQYDLAYMYEQGQGVKQNEKLAAHWYQLAAEGGDALGQYDYGQRCVLGMGIAPDPVEGLKWLLLAKAQGVADADIKAESARKNLSGEQISEARRRAAAFVPRSPRH